MYNKRNPLTRANSRGIIQGITLNRTGNLTARRPVTTMTENNETVSQ